MYAYFLEEIAHDVFFLFRSFIVQVDSQRWRRIEVNLLQMLNRVKASVLQVEKGKVVQQSVSLFYLSVDLL